MKRFLNSSLRLAGCVSVFSALLFTACTSESPDLESPEVATSSNLQVQLAPEPKEPINLVRTSGDSENSEKRANTSGGPDRGRYNITLQFVTPVTERQEQVFEDAAGRWEEIIIGDEPSVQGPIPSGFGGLPDIEGTIDDIFIEVALAQIDGPGGILGQAGPRFVRSDNFLSLTGVMFFDVDDLDALEQFDLLEEVIVHEMGHVLGVGTLWNVAPFFDRTLIADTETDPYFLGQKANVHWNAEGGTLELPVEDQGGPGTRLGHWRESALDNELMTGFINLGENPLSRITAGSMKDLGYKAANRGEKFNLPKGTAGVAAKSSNEGLNIAEMETLLLPIGTVDVN